MWPRPESLNGILTSVNPSDNSLSRRSSRHLNSVESATRPLSHVLGTRKQTCLSGSCVSDGGSIYSLPCGLCLKRNSLRAYSLSSCAHSMVFIYRSAEMATAIATCQEVPLLSACRCSCRRSRPFPKYGPLSRSSQIISSSGEHERIFATLP